MPTSRFSIMSTRPKPCALPMASIVSMSSTRPIALPSSATGLPFSKLTTTCCGSSGASLGDDDELEGVLRRRHPRVLEHAALVAAPPQVLVDRVRALLGERDRDVVRGHVVEQLLAAGPVGGARRGDDGAGSDPGCARRCRCAPGRCPCRCSRGRRRWRRTCAPSRRASWRSAAADRAWTSGYLSS